MVDLQRTQWAIVINGNEERTIEEINKDLTCFCQHNCDKWYKILHDMDKKDNGELKTKHIHAVMELPSRVRKSSLLRWLSVGLQINANQISIEDVKNISRIVQYLIHMNDKDKYQYDKKNIETNDDERLKYLLTTCEKSTLSTEELFDIIDNARNVRELIKKIGIDMYMKYGRVIDLLWKDKKENSSVEYVYNNDELGGR